MITTHKSIISFTPEADDGDFSAFRAATDLLHSLGYSYGPLCYDAPVGFKLGEFYIAKWYNIPQYERRQLDGIITSTDYRNGIAVVTFYLESATMPEEVLNA